MEEKKGRKAILIICGVTAFLLICLTIRIEYNKLPEESGVSVYFAFSDMTEAKYYERLSAGGYAYGSFVGDKIWLSREEYEKQAEDHWFKPHGKPLSIWTYSPNEPGIRQLLVEEKGTRFYFAVKESGEAKADSITVRRWPLELAGTDAVKENSWTGREEVDYDWKEGGLGGLSKGSFLAEPGYLYSIFVSWGSGWGWDEFSFSALQAGNEGETLPN